MKRASVGLVEYASSEEEEENEQPKQKKRSVRRRSCWVVLTGSAQEAANVVRVVDRASAGGRPRSAPRPHANGAPCGRTVRNVRLRAARLAPQGRALHVSRGRADPRQNPRTLSPCHRQTRTQPSRTRPMGTAHLSLPSLVPASTSARRIQTCRQTSGFYDSSVRSILPPERTQKLMTFGRQQLRYVIYHLFGADER